MKTQIELATKLAGKLCVCGAAKTKGQSFCRGCYFAIRSVTRSRLCRGIGDGYEEAYEAAVNELRTKGRLD